MFNEVPSRRISERKTAWVVALYGGLLIAGGIVEFLRRDKISWSDAIIGVVMFLLGIVAYRRLRHPDPWNPPDYEPGSTKVETTGKNLKA